MAGKPKEHLVDGEYITVQEAAARLGLRRQQLYSLMSVRGVSLQVAARLVRENLALGQGNAARYMINGQWATVRDVADKLGIKVTALRSYLYRHGCGLAEARADYLAGRVKQGGRRAVVHRVGRREMTTEEAAAQLGVTAGCIRTHMYKHKASLAQTIRYYERKKQKKAEKEILRILRGG